MGHDRDMSHGRGQQRVAARIGSLIVLKPGATPADCPGSVGRIRPSKTAAFFIAALLLAGAARADTQPLPYAILTQPSRCPLSNCSIAVGGTAQTVLNANAGRKMFCLSNPSAATEDLFYDFGQTASVTLSLALPKGSTVCMGGAAIWQGSVSINAATGGHAFAVEEFQ